MQLTRKVLTEKISFLVYNNPNQINDNQIWKTAVKRLSNPGSFNPHMRIEDLLKTIIIPMIKPISYNIVIGNLRGQSCTCLHINRFTFIVLHNDFFNMFLRKNPYSLEAYVCSLWDLWDIERIKPELMGLV